MLQWLTRKERHVGADLVHVKGKHCVGKTRFLQEVGYYLYSRRIFDYKIAYVDLEKCYSQQVLREKLQELKLFEQNQQKIEHESHPQELQRVRKILLIFDNVDRLVKEVFNIFERRLEDLISKNPALRVLISSRKNLKFQNFRRPDLSFRPNDANISQNLQNHSLDTSQINVSSKRGRRRTEVFHRLQEIQLGPLTDAQAVDLLLVTCNREITKTELGLSENSSQSVHMRL